MRLTFVGCGDAFGSGGRFNTCFHVDAPKTSFLIDCGASSLVALKRTGIDRNAIETIFVTHFHGDHFGGIPYFVLDAQFFAKRRTPLTIVGPEGTEAWVDRVMETTFPGSAAASRKFDLRLLEADLDTSFAVNGVDVLAKRVRHGPPEGPFQAYRFTVAGKTIAYTGDTEWVDALTEIGRAADVLIAEAYFRNKQVPLHLDLATLETQLPAIGPKRLILTHMNDDMLAHAPAVPFETAEDGKVIEL
ncbi:MAG: MBL fold metallo-hydrolase [Pseudomonadota bacterium]